MKRGHMRAIQGWSRRVRAGCGPGGARRGRWAADGGNPGKKKWLPDMDSNHDKQIQSLLCYRYTIGQARLIKRVCVPGRSSRVRMRGG